MEDLNKLAQGEAENIQTQAGDEDEDPENDMLHRPLLKENQTLSSSPLAIVGAKVSHIESLDYE